MIKTISFSLIILLGIFSCGNQTSKEETGKSDLIKKLEFNIENKLDSSNFVGMGVAIIKDNKLAYINGHGLSNLENNTKYTKQSIQPIGSISKLFIGLAMAKAIELGYFDLNTNINKILPFEVNNPFHPNDQIKISHLVTHTSGIKDSDLFWSNCYFINDTTKTDQGTEYIKKEHLATSGNIPSLRLLLTNYFTLNKKWYGEENFIDSKPGDTYEYSNVGSSLAAFLIESKSDISFKEFCEKYIFKPLKLNNTSWQKPKENGQVSTLYLTKNSAIPSFQLSSYPDGGLQTTTEDLSTFLIEMMKGYQGESTILKKESFQLLFEKKLDTLPNSFPKGTNSGIFWDWMRDGRLGHNGADPGLFTKMSFDPEKQTGLILLFNKDIFGTKDRKNDYFTFKEFEKLLMDFEKE